MIQKHDHYFSTTGCQCVLRRTITHSISPKREAQIRAYYPESAEASLHLNALEESAQYDAVAVTHAIIRACPAHVALDAEGIVAEFKKVEMTTRGTMYCQCQYVMRVTRPDPNGEPVFEIGDHPVYTKLCDDHEHHRKPDGTVAHQAHFDDLKAEYDGVQRVKAAASEALGVPLESIPVLIERVPGATRVVRTPQVDFAGMGISGPGDYPALAESIQTLRAATAKATGLAVDEIQIQLSAEGLTPTFDMSTVLPKLIETRIAEMKRRK